MGGRIEAPPRRIDAGGAGLGRLSRLLEDHAQGLRLGAADVAPGQPSNPPTVERVRRPAFARDNHTAAGNRPSRPVERAGAGVQSPPGACVRLHATVQYHRPAVDVVAARHVEEQPADWHDVYGPLWRRSDSVPPRRSIGARAALDPTPTS